LSALARVQGGWGGVGIDTVQVSIGRDQSNRRDLPVEQPSTFKLAVNLKTAKAMNYNVPASLLLRADKIIE